MSLQHRPGPAASAHGGGFAYAQARIQARFAGLPAAADWQHLGGLRSLPAWLEEARNGALKPWVKGFSAQSGSHDIERGVRAIYLEAVDDTARMVPGPWRGAVHWCRWLALLPLFEHLAQGRAVPAWVGADPRLAALVGAATPPGGPLLEMDQLRALGIEGLLTPVLGGGRGHSVTARWRAEWLARWPRSDDRDRLRLARLVGRIDTHLAAFALASPTQTWPLRGRLREALRLEFHRHLLQPAAAFLYLALLGLDLERLRRALLDRALFGAAGRAGPTDPDAVAVTAPGGPVQAGAV